MIRAIAGFFAVVALLAGGASAERRFIDYPVATEQSVRPPDDCEQFLHGVCRNWRLGMWLPSLLDGFEPWRHGKASAVTFTDRFLYEENPAPETSRLSSQGGPYDGTAFTYGKAGPPKGTAVYDYANAIAFYSQGCCSWHTSVLAARVKAPPIVVVHRTLNGLRTERGIELNQTSQQVRERYGDAVAEPVPGQPEMSLLSYVHMYDSTCGQFQNFAFLHDRLVYIELLNGC